MLSLTSIKGESGQIAYFEDEMFSSIVSPGTRLMLLTMRYLVSGKLPILSITGDMEDLQHEIERS